MKKIPPDYPVQPLKPEDLAADKSTCGQCGRSWDDAIVTSMTPAPSGRCPFEMFHEEDREPDRRPANQKRDAGIGPRLLLSKLSYEEAQAEAYALYERVSGMEVDCSDAHANHAVNLFLAQFLYPTKT